MQPTQGANDPTQPRRRGIRLFRIAGINIRLEFSWFLLFALILVSLAIGHFPRVAPEHAIATYWVAGALATLLLFASLLAHELAHSWVALRAGIEIPEITLFVFGGAAQMSQEPQSPQVEFRVAIVGPLMSFALALGFAFLHFAFPRLPWLMSEILSYLAWINVALGIFNLLPGYPLDGGRVLRAFVWWRSGSLRRATRIASSSGSTFGIALAVLGGLQILFGGLVAGLWLVFIGLFLRGTAKLSYRSLILRDLLEETEVDQIMTPREQLITVPAGLTLQALVDDFVLQNGLRGFPVEENGRTVGIVSMHDVRKTDKNDWDRTTVGEVMAPLDQSLEVRPDDSLFDAFQRLSKTDRRRLVVMKEGRMQGFLSSGSITRYVELRAFAQSA